MKLIIELNVDHPAFDGGEGHLDDNTLRALFQHILDKVKFRVPADFVNTTGSVVVGGNEIVHWSLNP